MKRAWIGIVLLMCTALIASAFGVARIDSGLEGLRPEHPESYLELGEMEMLDDALSRDKGLGIELLVRAVYWGDQHDDPSTAASGCIALTEYVESDLARMWLWDLALLLDPSRENEWARMLAQQESAGQELDIEAARCVYAIRYHQQPLGSELFARTEIRARLAEAAFLGGIDQDELIRVLKLEIERGNEDSCRGRLYIADRGTPGRRVACPDHLRGLGMCANDDELRTLLRAEMVLGGVEVESWSAAASMSMDGAINLPSVKDLVRMFRVEAGKAFYRDGRWVGTP